MSSVDVMHDRLRNGELVIIHGATGTECERRNVPELDGAWNGEHPSLMPSFGTRQTRQLRWRRAAPSS